MEQIEPRSEASQIEQCFVADDGRRWRVISNFHDWPKGVEGGDDLSVAYAPDGRGNPYVLIRATGRQPDWYETVAHGDIEG